MAGYIGTAAVPQATQKRQAFTATAGQTSFATSGYSVGFVDVYMNGVKLAAADYTATNGSDVVLATAALVNDIVEIVAFTSFVADGSLPATGGTITGNLNVAGNVAVTGTVDGRDVAADGTKLDTNIPSSLGSAGQVLTVNGGASAAAWASPASSFASLSDTTVSSSDPTISTNPASGLGHIWVNTTTGFLYVLRDATAGANKWTNVGTGDANIVPPVYVTATGGTITTDGNFKVHTFNSSGVFEVLTLGNPSSNLEYLVIAGGGGGGSGAYSNYRQGGGGGAGGYLTSTFSALVGDYTITVGAGGGEGSDGTNSAIIKTSNSANIATANSGGTAEAAGGSGGGAQANAESATVGSAGAGTAGQGNAGGAASVSASYLAAAGGGGGSSAVGGSGSGSTGGAGGAGTSSSITGTAVTRAGGGGGGGTTTGGAGAALGGNGGSNGSGSGATANSGSGGGGAGGNRNSGASGGSGVVIIRYQFQ